MAAAVVGEVVGDRADERVLVGQLREQRQVFADVDAGDVRVDRPEHAAVLLRGVRLHVERFHVRRPARQPDEDHRRIVFAWNARDGVPYSRVRLQSEQIRHSQPRERSRPGLQQRAAADGTRTAERATRRIQHPIHQAGLQIVGRASRRPFRSELRRERPTTSRRHYSALDGNPCQRTYRSSAVAAP